MSDPILLDRDGLRRYGIDIPWAKDVKAWVSEGTGRVRFQLMYLSESGIHTFVGTGDEVKKRIVELAQGQ